MIDLSIWIVSYNHVKYIKQALDSVLMQETKYTYEIIITDDMSVDGTIEIIQDYLKKYPEKIRAYISDKNYGSPRCNMIRNRIELLGNFWCILEADDFWTSEDKIETQLDFLYKNSDYIGSTHSFYVKDEIKKSKRVKKPTSDKDYWDIYLYIQSMFSPCYNMYTHTSTWIWRNVFLNDQKKWIDFLKDKNTLGDLLLSFRMISYGGKVKFFDKVMSCYRVTGKGVWSSKSQSEQDFLNRIVYFRLFRTIKTKHKAYFVKELLNALAVKISNKTKILLCKKLT